jgi:hypothetical protein
MTLADACWPDGTTVKGQGVVFLHLGKGQVLHLAKGQKVLHVAEEDLRAVRRFLAQSMLDEVRRFRTRIYSLTRNLPSFQESGPKSWEHLQSFADASPATFDFAAVFAIAGVLGCLAAERQQRVKELVLQFLKQLLKFLNWIIRVLLRLAQLPGFLQNIVLIEQRFFHYNGVGRPPRSLSRALAMGLSLATGRMCSNPISA